MTSLVQSTLFIISCSWKSASPMSRAKQTRRICTFSIINYSISGDNFSNWAVSLSGSLSSEARTFNLRPAKILLSTSEHNNKTSPRGSIATKLKMLQCASRTMDCAPKNLSSVRGVIRKSLQPHKRTLNSKASTFQAPGSSVPDQNFK